MDSIFQFFHGQGYFPRANSNYHEAFLSYSHIPFMFEHTPSIRIWRFACTRNHHHIMEFWARLDRGSPEKGGMVLMKVGQYPSIADLEIHKVAKYKNILKRQHQELTKAIGLFSHGIGIGSMVYLRRIFEQLVEEVHQQARSVSGWDEETYRSLRFGDKIKQLDQTVPGKLPQFLVKNAIAYAVMSKGIHELSEDECRKDFPVILATIEMILDQRLAAEERKHKEEEVARQLAEAHARRK